MRSAVLLGALVAFAGCGGSDSPSPESVVHAWSAALDRNDNEAAARLFADDAQVIQAGAFRLESHADAVRWNASLPCGGRITSLESRGGDGDVLAVFVLTQRPGHACDAPGQRAAALFSVRHGRIVLWHQTNPPPASSDGLTA
jgi:limonene-1,2-epoxide hydrolase